MNKEIEMFRYSSNVFNIITFRFKEESIMTRTYDYSNMTLEQILAINEDENERDRELDEKVDSDKWNCCGSGRTTYGKNYTEE